MKDATRGQLFGIQNAVLPQFSLLPTRCHSPA